MATNTYVALDKVTVSGSSTSTITLNMGSSISQTYTDLMLVCNPTGVANCNLYLRFNGDTGSNYNSLYMYGNGSTNTSGLQGPLTYLQLDMGGLGTSFSNNQTVHINNYSNTTTYKTILVRTNESGYLGARASLWSSASAITSLTLSTSTSYFAAGSTFSLYGIRAATANLPDTARATGGTITYTNTDVIHTFLSSGTFTPSSNLTCDYLVVAGGGAGGSVGGGGGAGGFRTTFDTSGRNSAPEPKFSAIASTAYTVQVGGGGSAVNQDKGNSGTDSIFSTITSTGGGGGGSNQSGKFAGRDGGSGGGARGVGPAGLGTANQGFDGALSTYGGGGGAGTTGISPGTDAAGAAGGAGLPSTILGSTVYYAGGGGSASSSTSAAGGVGGGGAGGVYPGGGTAGSTNTGGGGGAGGDGGQLPGAGGSGIVIIRYPKA